MKTNYNSTLSGADANGGEQRQNNAIRRKWSALALGGFLFTSIFALSPSPVSAECQQWSVGHGWRFKQGPTAVQMNLQQNGTVITGTATHNISTNSSGNVMSSFGGTTNVNGDVDGTVKGNRFAVIIHWDNNTTGVYNGTIGPSGRIEGTGYEQRSPSKKVNWYSETHMVCADAPAVPLTNPPPKPIKSSGKFKPAPTPSQLPVLPGTGPESGTKGGFIQLHTPAPVPPPVLSTQGEAGKSTRPYIRALPQIVSIPRDGSEPTTKLVWFAGNDHPNAQLMVEVNGGDETLVDPQRKGSRQVKVKAGRRYVYSLVDAGEPLASVIVQTGQSASAPPERLRGNQRKSRQDGESDND